ncbi:MAG: glycosyltransferase family 9 protein [Candidatus Gastranaerophilales bacterium]|nr:glycosyltransferase family 9 protein [Candidatus Gastranaerophilales bacterium]
MNQNKINKVLIIRMGAIGDVVHTIGLVHSIKKAYPNIEIHYLTGNFPEFIFKEDIAISKVITANPKFKLFSSLMLELIKKLKQEKYDLAINLQPSLKNRALVICSGIKKEIIYKKNFKLHAVTNFWQTGLSVFPDMKEENLQLYLSANVINTAKKRLEQYKRPFIIINAGGMFSKRQGRAYPVDKWVELGNKLQDKYNGTIILNGAKEDKEFLQPLNNIKNSVNFIGELPLEDSCAVISLADLMISGDSGPLHIATALNVKSIGLYGAMPVQRTGCYSNGINITSPKPCSPCNKRKCKYLKKTNKIYAPCMDEIKPDLILEKVNDFIS